MFEVKTISGSSVIAKIAGTESTAKMMSVISMKTSARKSGVATSRPSSPHEETRALQLVA